MTLTVQAAALEVLQCADVPRKLALSYQHAKSILEAAVAFQHPLPLEPIDAPGRPDRPLLVSPRQLSARKLGSNEGRAVLLHAVAHIEFNAINLAWDAVYRFPDLPESYYRDWASVAADEARHFALLLARMQEMGFKYGDFPAHDGLWEMAQKTRSSLVHRMALVPRLLEARGLDVTPGMIAKLREVGDTTSSAILETILSEEIGHVDIGSRWFRFACQRANLSVSGTFLELLREFAPGAVRGPFNAVARLAAGFSAEEIFALEHFHAHQS